MSLNNNRKFLLPKHLKAIKKTRTKKLINPAKEKKTERASLKTKGKRKNCLRKVNPIRMKVNNRSMMRMRKVTSNSQMHQ